MPTEICYKCKELKQDVTLYADDRICPDCYNKNELALKAIRDAQQSNSITVVNPPTPTDKKGSRKQPPRTRLASAAAKKETNVVCSNSPVTTNNSNNNNNTVSRLKTAAISTPPVHNDNHKFQDIIRDLNNKVDSQSKVIESLTKKLNFVMSLFGISDDEMSNDDDDAAPMTTGNEDTRMQIGEMKQDTIQKTPTSVIGVLSQEIAEVKQSVIELQQATKQPVTGIQSDDINKQTAITVHRTLHDVNRRRRNVVVSGLDESSNDRQSFLDLCEYNLSIKPIVSEGDCHRLGTVRPDRPRLLLVKLRTEDAASEVLRAARQLRQCSNNDIARMVYINPDLSPEAAKLAFERRQRAREMRSVRQVAAVTDSNTGEQQRGPNIQTTSNNEFSLSAGRPGSTSANN